MTERASESSQALFVTAGARVCAIPLEHVAETMRPLPIEPVAEMPGFVRGISVIRGTSVPVIDLAALLESADVSASYGRFVTLKVAEGRAAVGVRSVVGLRTLDSRQLGELPPILRGAASDIIEAIGTRDAQLLVVLSAARLVPDEIWAALAKVEAMR
jgi:purine-binding chemotaxis protein CheW